MWNIFSNAILIHSLLLEHREHGNRIMHEFLLGQVIVKRHLPMRGKTDEYVMIATKI